MDIGFLLEMNGTGSRVDWLSQVNWLVLSVAGKLPRREGEREREREKEREKGVQVSPNHRQKIVYLAPKLLVEGTSYHAPLKENNDSLLVALGKFEVQVVPPRFQLNPLQRLDVKVRPLELKSNFRIGPRLNKSTAILLHSLHLQISLSLPLLPWSFQTLYFSSLSPSPLGPSRVLPGRGERLNTVHFSILIQAFLWCIFMVYNNIPTSSLEPISVQSSVYSSLSKVSDMVLSSINFLKLESCRRMINIQHNNYYTSMVSIALSLDYPVF